MSEQREAELIGLVIAGGASRRMGRDKGALVYHELPQAEHCHRLLLQYCARAFVSVNAQQSPEEPYRRLPRIEDTGVIAGPAAGLLAAWTEYPDAALLVLAVDLPLVDSMLLDYLIANRNPDCAATVWIHADGILEPVFGIWEPALRRPLLEASEAGTPSLRRLLDAADVERLEPPNPELIVSINNAADYRRILSALARR